MEEQLKKRLELLKREFAQGQEMLAQLDMQRNELQQKILRISGAIQVLEEELGIYNKTGGGNKGNPE